MATGADAVDVVAVEHHASALTHPATTGAETPVASDGGGRVDHVSGHDSNVHRWY